MQFLTVENIVRFYTEAIDDHLLRNPDGLASAAGGPQHSVFGDDAYPSLSQKAAALMHSLAENQPFVDYNKRIAWICGKVFLELHGVTMQATDAEAVELCTDKGAGGMTVAELAN